jgi:hypothetical protein
LIPHYLLNENRCPLPHPCAHLIEAPELVGFFLGHTHPDQSLEDEIEIVRHDHRATELMADPEDAGVVDLGRIHEQDLFVTVLINQFLASHL